MMSKMTQSKAKRATRRRKGAGKVGPLLISLGGVFLLALSLWAISLGSDTPDASIEVRGSPRLRVDGELERPDTVDLGDVKLGQTVEVFFELTNVGDQPLRFLEAPYIEVVEGC